MSYLNHGSVFPTSSYRTWTATFQPLNSRPSAHLLHYSAFPPLPQLSLKSSVKATGSPSNQRRSPPSMENPSSSNPPPTDLVLPVTTNPTMMPVQDGSLPAKSYRQAVTGNSTASDQPTFKVDVSFSSASKRKLSSHDGEPALILSQEEEEKSSLPYSYTLIGKFSRGKPSMAELRKEISASSFNGKVHLGLHDFRHVFFKFELEEDFHRMWSRRVWNFSGFKARIFRWSKDFSPEIESSVAPVWINLPQLPLHLYEKDSLFTIASAVGNPLKLDHATASAKNILRPSEARILVEMDVLKPRIHRVWIGSNEWGRWQPILFEDSPDYCTNCSKMGHSVTQCKPPQPRNEARMEEIRKGKRKIWIPVVNSSKSHDAKDGQSSRCPDSSEAATGAVAASDANGVPNPLEETGADQGKAHAMKEVESPKKMAKEQEANFLANLGQFLELLNQEEETVVLDRAVGFPLPAIEQKTQIVSDLMSTTQPETETTNGKQNGEQGNVNNASSLVTHVQPKFQFAKSDLEILSKMEKNKTMQLENNPVKVGVEKTVEEENATPAATAVANPDAPAANAVVDPTSVGEMVEFVLENDLSGKQMGSTVRDLAGLSGNPCNAAGHAVMSNPTFGEGKNVEIVRNLVDLSGQQESSTELENILPLAGQKTNTPKVQDVEVTREQTASAIISPAGKVMTWNNISGFKMGDSEQTLEFDNDTGARGVIEDRPKGLNILNEAWSNLVGLSHITPQFQTNGNFLEENFSYESDEDGFDRWTENSYEEDEVAMARGVIEGGKVKLKYGMSDRVLRSMSRASSSDPCLPRSL